MLKDKPPKKSKFRQNIRDFRFYVKVSKKKSAFKINIIHPKMYLFFKRRSAIIFHLAIMKCWTKKRKKEQSMRNEALFKQDKYEKLTRNV